MTVLLIILGIFTYLVIAGIVASMNTNPKDFDIAKGLLWPIIIPMLIGAIIHEAATKTKIEEENKKK